jgi:hypothetical protein
MALFSRRVLFLATAALVLGLCGGALLAQDSSTLFPSVKLLLPEDLNNFIVDYELQHNVPHDNLPVLAPVLKTIPTPPSTATPAKPPEPKTVAASATSAASARPAAPAASYAPLLKKFATRADNLDAGLKHARAIRDFGRAESKDSVKFDKNFGPGSEAFVQYYLLAHGDLVASNGITNHNVVRYLNYILTTITIQRRIYVSAEDGVAQVKKILANENLTPEDKAAAEDLVKRFGDCRQDALLDAAEGYGLIRSFGPAGRLYDLLLKESPSDPNVKQSHDHYLEVRARPLPTKPPQGPGD